MVSPRRSSPDEPPEKHGCRHLTTSRTRVKVSGEDDLFDLQGFLVSSPEQSLLRSGHDDVTAAKQVRRWIPTALTLYANASVRERLSHRL